MLVSRRLIERQIFSGSGSRAMPVFFRSQSSAQSGRQSLLHTWPSLVEVCFAVAKMVGFCGSIQRLLNREAKESC